jgi:CP family cyanate transporter-like MFS transporter
VRRLSDGCNGPLLLGKVHDWCGGWTVPLLMTAAIAVVGACTGLAAGRNVYLEPATSAG